MSKNDFILEYTSIIHLAHVDCFSLSLLSRETPQFPVEAIRESLMNAVAHKDYADATPIQISVYPDHMDAVASYKLLPPIIEIVSGLMITYYTDIHSQLNVLKVEEKFFPVIEYVVQNGSITNTDVQKILKVSKPTATRILKSLNSILEMCGTSGKGIYYTLIGSQWAHK